MAEADVQRRRGNHRWVWFVLALIVLATLLLLLVLPGPHADDATGERDPGLPPSAPASGVR